MELESDVKFMQVCVIEEIKQLVLDLWYERLPLSQAIDLHSSQRHPVCHSRAIVLPVCCVYSKKGCNSQPIRISAFCWSG
jgi:hypothetical protein